MAGVTWQARQVGSRPARIAAATEMTKVMASITQFLPLTYVNEALRAVVNDGAGITTLGPQLLGMGVWAVITFVIAIRLFRWE